MYYGSAQNGTWNSGSSWIMFKALFLEGFARLLDGVRVIIRVLLEIPLRRRRASDEMWGGGNQAEREGRAAALTLTMKQR